MARFVVFTARQAVAIFLAALAYFGVRGLTEGGYDRAYRNAELVVSIEQRLHIDVELTIQGFIEDHDRLLTVANWIYIFGHWPVIIATLVWLAVARRRLFYQLRNALFLSGAVGLVIFATWAVMPPRLFSPEYVDTVTVRSNAYRLLQPPGLINKYAALPSFHFGWNLLVGIMWIRATNSRLVKIAGVVMPLAMAFAVVATANHWLADVIVGGAIASAALVFQCNADRLLPIRRPPLVVHDAGEERGQVGGEGVTQVAALLDQHRGQAEFGDGPTDPGEARGGDPETSERIVLSGVESERNHNGSRVERSYSLPSDIDGTQKLRVR